MSAGKVWLVGAGPGDVGLLTLKGQQVLQKAQVVVYDSLVGQSVLALIPQEAETIDVGKRAGNHKVPQEEINEILLAQAMEGKRVVRLKGGDPFLFGRGGEELELLEQHHIPYEVVPGVTSSIAVPAYNGIPVTHRDFCSSVHIITGHKKKDQPLDMDFSSLVKLKGTLVFLMGVSALPEICQGLIAAGMDRHMPAAILQQGTTAAQKRVVATVETLEQEVKKQGIQTPAIVVVGQVCSLSDRFSWCEQLPLWGKKILVTRPRNLISGMASRLREQGAEVLELPAISTEKIWPNEKLNTVIQQIHNYKWIAFTSQVGVQIFMEAMLANKKDARALAGTRIAVIGKATAKALEQYGILADLIPEVYDGESLGKALVANGVGQGTTILLPRAKIGSRELVEVLEEVKAQITEVATYDTIMQSPGIIDEKEELQQGNIDYAVFTSASTVEGFAKAVEGADLTKLEAVCIGKQTAAAASAYGIRCHVASQATMDSVVKKLMELCGNHNK